MNSSKSNVLAETPIVDEGKYVIVCREGIGEERKPIDQNQKETKTVPNVLVCMKFQLRALRYLLRNN